MPAVIFDLDGVLIDSEPLWQDVRRGLAVREGLAWPKDATSTMQGVGTADWSGYLAGVVGIPGPPEAIAKQVIEELAGRYAERLPLMPGALDAVARMAAVWPLGLASGSPRELIDTIMNETPLGDLFQVAVASDEVAANKPAPDVYLEVARRLGVEPGHAVAIEDSANGFRSALAGGLRLVAVPQPGFPPAPDALALADAVVGSLDEVTVELISGLLGNA